MEDLARVQPGDKFKVNHRIKIQPNGHDQQARLKC
jgi:hypothetical protein